MRSEICAALLASILILVFSSGMAAAVDGKNPIASSGILKQPAVKVMPPPAQQYHYRAVTRAPVLKSGQVKAGTLSWQCQGSVCKISGPWPTPAVSACITLASQVGAIRSYGYSGHMLSAAQLKQCNAGVVKKVRPTNGVSEKFKRLAPPLKPLPKPAAPTGGNRLVTVPVPDHTLPGLKLTAPLAESQVFTPLPAEPKVPATRNSTKKSQFPGSNLAAAVKAYRQPILEKTIRHKLVTGKETVYTVLTQTGGPRNTGVAVDRTAFAHHAWKGKILLPNLARQAKAIRIAPKGEKATGAEKSAQWALKNPDGSLSKRILDVNGRLAGNITFTRDGSVRIGIDLSGNQEADLYEMVTSDGEHSLLASPAGKAALEHFLSGGKNPLCNPGMAGARPAGGGFAGGMISGGDKTAMQVACGQNDHKPGNGGSAAGGSGGVSGNPGGQLTDTMCKDVLSRHRGRPGNPGMVQGDPAPEDRENFNWSRALAGAAASLFHIPPDKKTDSTGQDIVTVLGVIFGGGAANVTNPIGDGLNAGAPRFVNEADRDLKYFEERQDPGDNTHPDPAVVDRACAAGSTSRYCGAWHRDHDSERSGSNNNGGDNASDPGPDQQNDSDTALYNLCQARARSQAMWDSNTKDTSYVHQLCENPASQPNPAGEAGSATLGGAYGSSVTLATYCGQDGGQGTPAPSAERLTEQAGDGRHCGPTESPGADGQCHGVGRQFGLGNGKQVNVTYGAIIGFTPFNPAFDPPPAQ